MSTDSFERNYSDAQNRVERLRGQISEITNARPGQSVASQKYLMKATWATLQTDLSNFDQLMYYYNNEPHKYQGVGKKEIARRINLINEIKEIISGELTQEYRALDNTAATLQAPTDNLQRDENGNIEQLDHLDNRGLLQQQKKMIKDSDDQLDEVIGVVKATKYEAQDFNSTIKSQNAQISVLGQNIDRTTDNMIDADTKMKHLLKTSNHCYLWMVIVVELLILILFFFIL